MALLVRHARAGALILAAVAALAPAAGCRDDAGLAAGADAGGEAPLADAAPAGEAAFDGATGDGGVAEASGNSPGGADDGAAAGDGNGHDDVGAGAGDAGTDGRDVDAGDAVPDGDSAAPARVRTPASAFSGELRAASFAGQGTSWSRAVVAVADRVVTANPDSDSITVLAGTPLAVSREIAVGRDPRTVAVTSDGRYAAVVNRGDATVSLVDLEVGRELFYFSTRLLPYGIVIAGGRLFVTEWATGSVVVFDPVARVLVGRVAVTEFPAGLAHCGPPSCALAGGRGLLVTHFYSGRLSFLDPDALGVVAEISTGADTNFSQQVAIAPDGGRAYLPQTRSFADNPTRQFDSSVFPVVNVVDLASRTLLNPARVTLDTADQPVGLPFAVEFLADGRLLAVANAASDDLSVIDLATGNRAAHIALAGSPQGLARGADDTLFVNEVLGGKLRVVSGAPGPATTRAIGVTASPLPMAVARGKRLFWSSSRTDLARDRWMSCATCHFDGFHDGRTWRTFPDGPRNTTALFNLVDTAPLHWSGDLDELHDVEATVRFIQAGKGLAPAPQIDTLGAPLTGASKDLDDLAAYLATLRPPPSPHTNDPAAIARGTVRFSALGCPSCHAGPHFTDRELHDVGTGDPALERNSHGRGVHFDTPSLRALWLTPPYLHDGTAATLEDVFTRGPVHDLRGRASVGEIADLVSYLRAL